LSQTNQQKWLYTGHLYSYIYSTVLIVASIYATLSCELPNNQDTTDAAAESKSQATIFTDNYCRDNTNDA